MAMDHQAHGQTNKLLDDSLRERILAQFQSVRRTTEHLVEPLETEDYILQAIPDVSPPKWHLAHTTWFFETFILSSYVDDYETYNPHFQYLFNSYYESLGDYFPRPSRGLLSRPSVDEVFGYREYVDEKMASLIRNIDLKLLQEISDLIEIGVHHEQQHQELILTDVKYNFAVNPLKPVYVSADISTVPSFIDDEWQLFEGGLVEIGKNPGDGFSFDNERPRHKVWLEPYRISTHPVTNGEFIEFMEDGGYEQPTLWLSEGWNVVKELGWQCPLYWFKKDGKWHYFTLSGVREVRMEEPVCHISYFEADAYARWAGKRLPTEAEWEHAFAGVSVSSEKQNFVEAGHYHPLPLSREDSFSRAFGDVWEWTQSPYTAYPRSKSADGALGEYNAKFMSGQMVLRGGSCATPASHIRSTYRNFFQPEKRWQFSGFRLAADGR